MSLSLKLMPHQVEFVTDIKHRFVGFVGGYGTGKSIAFCNRGILCAKRNPGCLGALMEPVTSMVETDLVPTWETTLDEAGIKWEHESKSHHIYKLHFPGQRPSRVQLMSAENHMRLRGKNLAWWGVDEFDTIKPLTLQKLVLEQLIARLRAGYSEETESGFFVSTPEGFGGMWEFFVQDVDRDKRAAEEEGVPYAPDRVLFTAKTTDNYLLKPSYVATLRKQYSPQLLEAYLEGKFVNLTRGTVYSNFDKEFNATKLTIADFLGFTLHMGCDFNNFKRGGSSAVIGVIKNDVFYVLDEVMACRKTKDMCDIIRQRYPNHRIIAHPDKSGGAESANSERSNIAYLEEAGFEVMYQDGLGSHSNPDIIDCVNCVNGRILDGTGARKVFINPTNCPITFSSIQRQPFDDKGMPLKDNKVDGPMDALRYPIWNVWGTSKRRGFSTGSVSG